MDNQFIKGMDDFFVMLKEAFNSPLPIKWIDNTNELIGLFTINDNVYQINCVEKSDGIWKYDFYIVEKSDDNIVLSPELTGKEKDKFRVLPTILNGLDALIEKKSPMSIIVGATDKSRGRKKLYESHLKDLSIKKGYEFYTRVYQSSDDISDTKQIFVLYKEDINKDILSKVIFKSIEEEK